MNKQTAVPGADSKPSTTTTAAHRGLPNVTVVPLLQDAPVTITHAPGTVDAAEDAVPSSSRALPSSAASPGHRETMSLMDKSPSPAASLPEPDILPVPSGQIGTVRASSSHGLSTITETNSTEDECSASLMPPPPKGSLSTEAVCRTPSSCSIPDYLCHKLHSHSIGSTDHSDSHHRHHLKPQPTRTTTAASSAAPDSSAVQASPNAIRLVKESCDSSTTTTTSESYQLSDLPPLPAKLATLSKPPTHSLIATALRTRKARHSIDVRALPSYLAKKRQSTFGQFLSG